MSRYRIEVTRDALRALAKLDKLVREVPSDRGPLARELRALAKLDKLAIGRVHVAIDGLGENPRPSGVIPLLVQGRRGAYRLRVGNYRVIYTVDDSRLVVLVVDLGHRFEIYRDL